MAKRKLSQGEIRAKQLIEDEAWARKLAAELVAAHPGRTKEEWAEVFGIYHGSLRAIDDLFKPHPPGMAFAVLAYALSQQCGRMELEADAYERIHTVLTDVMSGIIEGKIKIGVPSLRRLQ
jgi:hypothetical protein